jgi:IS30 family transposase
VRAYLVRCGGIRPVPRRRRVGRLVLREREEISRGLAAGMSLRAIAVQLGRAPSTISREVAGNGGRRGYRALRADRAAWSRATRPKRCKLAVQPGLRDIVEDKLCRRWSPQQISGWLARTYPSEAAMQISHESIYRTLYVQTRGALRRELTQCLRTGRVLRRPKGVRLPDGRGGRPNTLHISERPAEAEDRAVPGHWEGDLIFGKNMSPVAILVERSARYLLLVALPAGNHQADAVADALAAAITRLPTHLAKSLTWDLGHEMAQHARFSRDRDDRLLLRPEIAMAARQQRKHQRIASPVPAPSAELPRAHPGPLRRHRHRTQRPPSTNPRLQDTIRSTSRSIALTA